MPNLMLVELIMTREISNVSFRKQLGRKKNNLMLTTAFSQRYKESLYQGDVTSLMLMYQANLGKRHSISTQARYMINSTGIISNSSFNEQRVSIQYGFKL